jgi:cell division protease FtsH
VGKKIMKIASQFTLNKLARISKNYSKAISPLKTAPIKPTFISSTLLTTQHLRNYNSKSHSSSSAHPTWSARKPTITFKNVASNAEVIDSLSDISSYLQNPSEFTKAGIQAPLGVVLSGPPGTGKTMLAEALAGDAKSSIVMVSAAELQGKWVGKIEQNMREIFETAKKHTPCILCIDEIDAIAGKRFSSFRESNEHYINAHVDQLLSLLSEPHPGVVVIGTTNNYDLLDPAVIRPGRFDKHIYIPLPDFEARKSIIALHTKNKKVDTKIDLTELAQLSPGFSCATIAGWVNQAAILAAKNRQSTISHTHFDQARSILLHGILSQPQTDIHKKIDTAKRVAGHAIVGHYLGLKLYKTSILRAGKKIGFSDFIIDEQESYQSKSDALKQICESLAGRAAEMLYGEPHFGNSEGIEKAKKIAINMVQNEGMGTTLTGGNVSIDVERILAKQLTIANEILKEHKTEYERVIEALVKHDELHYHEFIDILAGKQITKIKPISPSKVVADEAPFFSGNRKYSRR